MHLKRCKMLSNSKGIKPKGAIQVIEFENRTEFYNKYVRAGEVLTLTVPMTVKAHLNQNRC